MHKNKLSTIAEENGVDCRDTIDPVKLAVALVRAGMPVRQAAELCGVGRTALHRKIKHGNK